MRRRPPQAGDHWSGCTAVRRAGSAPLYAGEPGYSANMDGDSDGVACEDPGPGNHLSGRRFAGRRRGH
nr:excalibur calcium-binding domain-containing protein [Novosphingobium sp. 9U]